MGIKRIHADVESVGQNKEQEDAFRLLFQALHHLGTVFSKQEISAYHQEERDSRFSEGDKDIAGFAVEGPVDRNDQEGHDTAHDVDGMNAGLAGKIRFQVFSLLSRNQRDDVLIKAADNGRKADREKDRQKDIHARAGYSEDRAVVKSDEEEVMEKVKFQRNRSQEFQDRVSETDLHHDKQKEDHKAHDPRKLHGKAAELIADRTGLPRDLAPVRVLFQGVVRLHAEEPGQAGEERKQDDVCFSGKLSKDVGVLRHKDADDKEEGGIVPPFTHEPVTAGEILAVAEPQASTDHGEHEDRHEDRCDGSVFDQAVKDKEYEVKDRDLYDIPHVGIDERPAGKHSEDLPSFELRAAGAQRQGKYQDTHIKRHQDRDIAFFEEALQVVLFILQAGVKAVAREEKEDADEKNATAGQKLQRACFIHKFLA